ncbi:MAG: hypothetical protein H7X79_13195 [Sporomusaceae bacterium]|nr:hypothetical protein [Sporomusaceae bacterium]
MNCQNINQTSSQADTNTIVNSYMGAGSSTIQTPANTSSTANNSITNNQQQNQTIIGVFKSRPNAEQAVNSLRQQGFTNEEINIISKNQQQKQNQQQGTTFDDNIADGTLTGSTLGGIGGLLLGAGALLIPGVGPILAVGPITGAIGGAIAGGIAGGLIDWGIPAEESQRYQQEVVQGSILAIIRTDSAKVNSVAQILRQNGANEVKNHSK